MIDAKTHTCRRAVVMACLFLMTLMLAPAQANAQNTTDFGAQLSAEYQQKAFNNWFFSVKEEVRFNENVSRYARSKTMLGVDYKLPRYGLKIGGGVYYLNRYTDKNIYRNKYRFDVNISYKYDYRNWDFAYRMRFQWLFHDETRSYHNYTPDFYWRNRASVAYSRPFSRFSYEISGEIYSLLNADRRFDFESLRLMAEVTYRLTRRQFLSAFVSDNRDYLTDSEKLRTIYLGISWKFKQ